MQIVVVETWMRPELAAETILRKFQEERVHSLLVLCSTTEKAAICFTAIPQMTGADIEEAVRDVRHSFAR